MPLSSQSKMGSRFNLFSICSEVNSTCYSPPKLANQNAQKAPLICEYVLMKVIFGWLMAISFSCILASTCVTSSPPVAIYHLVRNVHTRWMIPAITLKTLHILLVIIWHSANTEDIHCCFAVVYMVWYPLCCFLEKEPSPVSWGSPHSAYASFLGNMIVSLGLCHGTNLLQMLVRTSHSHLSWFAFESFHL